ncbi:par-5 [Symbiodinium necroappetens]|uniref:Par-5 protein n=1 Tax=Symbiodinium necroappetens TaxID=1628268 RepID=A0A812YIF6_9DINO|nr:par-5 [Symbiodinium necroappetens]
MGAAQACCQGGSQRLVLQSTSLLYLDRDVESDRGSAKARSRDSSTPRIVSGKLRGVPILRVPSSAYPWTASSIERSEVDEFKHMLGSHGIDTTCWGSQGAKAVEQLFWEIFYQHGSILTGIGTGKLKRVTRILKLRILAEINGIDHVMVSRLQFMHDGQQIQRQQLPLGRLCWKMPSDNALLQSCKINLCDENNEYAESWRSCWPSVLEARLGICSSAFQHQLDEVTSAYSYHTEDNVHSEGYPGLKALYCVHQVTFRVTNPAHSKVACIGLPLGQDFATANDNFCLERFHSKDALPIGSQLNVWSWAPLSEFNKVYVKPSFSETTKTEKSPGREEPVPQCVEDELMMRKRVPISASMSKLASMDNVAHAASGKTPKKTAPNAKLRRVLSSKRTDWRTVRKIASNLLDKNYTLSQFMQDLAAFPELSLYLRDGVVETGSGRTADDEYQRTICAFFAIYWLMRLDIDGRQGFCFGTDETWTALKESAVQDGQVAMESALPNGLQKRFYQLERRLAFFNNAQWSFFRRLMVDAGLLEASFQNGRNTFRVKETRMVSLLALTAIHDIMKIENLLPTVQPEHDGYHGYAAGDVIGDHDHALCYVMDHYPDLLPSFKDLDPAERQSVQFTQCNLCFNHGWLVQAEAPAGAIFSKFREAVARDRRVQGGARDIALYFVHWLTDLAGAEPTPLGGCEKFVIKFPLHVLNSFLQSFKFIEGISVRTETQVMEKYLKYRWSDHVPTLGEPPKGPHAIAAMRLLCMAQANGRTIVDAFNQELSSEDKEVLSVEMSRTGCAGQFFSPELTPSEVISKAAGPAFLVYYGPAFLQALGSDSAVLRLRVLSEIYRCAREIWPESEALVAVSVHVRIDTIKGLAIRDIQDVLTRGDLWLVTKHNESEAFVERASHGKLNRLVRGCQKFQVLDLGFLRDTRNI